MVNKRLSKPEFDCAHLDEEYDCGCGDPPLNAQNKKAGANLEDERTGVGLTGG